MGRMAYARPNRSIKELAGGMSTKVNTLLYVVISRMLINIISLAGQQDKKSKHEGV